MNLAAPAFTAVQLLRQYVGPNRRSFSHHAAGVRCFIAVALVSLCALVTGAVAAETNFVAVPTLEKRVTDLTATLSSADEGRIEARLKEFEVRKGAQIAVLIVGTTQPETIFDYALRVTDAWKLGRKGVDDGVLFVIAKDDRKLQILTGRGTQGVLTDAMSKRIIAEIVAPKFRSGDFAGGIDDGVAKIIDVLQGEALPPPPQKRADVQGGSNIQSFLVLGIFAAMFVGPLLRSLLGRFVGASATGGAVGAAAWWLAGGMLFPVVAGVIIFFIVLFMGAMNFAGGRGGGWTTGGGGFGGGGGSGGGFSGGGGGFDGGGASGDW